MLAERPFDVARPLRVSVFASRITGRRTQTATIVVALRGGEQVHEVIGQHRERSKRCGARQPARHPRERSGRPAGEVHDEQRADRVGEVLRDREAIAMQADHDAAQRQRGVIDTRPEGTLAGAWMARSAAAWACWHHASVR